MSPSCRPAAPLASGILNQTSATADTTLALRCAHSRVAASADTTRALINAHLAATVRTVSMSTGKTSTIRDAGSACAQALHEGGCPANPSLQSQHSGPFLHHWQSRFTRVVLVRQFRWHEAHMSTLSATSLLPHEVGYFWIVSRHFCASRWVTRRHFTLELMSSLRRFLDLSRPQTLSSGRPPPLRLEGPSCPCFVISSMHCTASAAEVLVGGSDSSALRFMLGRAQPLASIANAAWGRGRGRVWGGGGETTQGLGALS